MVGNISEEEVASPRTRTLLARGLDLGSLRWAALLLLATLILRLPIFFYPFFNGDEATYSALANALLDGKWLYVDAVDHKPPFIYWTYAAVLGACGRYNIHAVHLFSVFCVFAAGLLLGATARAFGLCRERSRLVAVFFIVLCSLGPGKDMLAANAELFMLLPTVAAMLLLVRARSRKRESATGRAMERMPAAVAAGFLIGLAALFKYQGGTALFAVLSLVLLSRFGSRSRREDAGTIAAFFLGFLLPFSVIVGVWGFSGRLGSLLFWAWQYPLVYAGKLSVSRILWNLLRMTATWGAVTLGLLVASAIGFRALRKARDERQRALGLFALSWLAGSALGVAAGGRFFLHYYLQFAAPIALLAAAAQWRSVLARRVAVAYTAILLTAFWATNAFDHRVRPRIGHYTEAYVAIGEWMRLHTSEDARLLVWGNSPEIYFFSHRRMGTRFPFCNYHSGKIWGTAADDEPTQSTRGEDLGRSKAGDGRTGSTEKEALPEAWPMLIEDLIQRRPAVIVDAASAGLDRWSGYELFRYPRLWDIVQRDYREAARIAGATIYVRTNPG
jgi:4-amino-4-deoxy-L-arabinose transferase-like glycosyltransferase